MTTPYGPGNDRHGNDGPRNFGPPKNGPSKNKSRPPQPRRDAGRPPMGKPFNPKRKPVEPKPGQPGAPSPTNSLGSSTGKPPTTTTPAGALRTDWDPVASWYDALVGEEGSEYQQRVVFPGVLRLLTVRPSERILDVACGQGAFSRALQKREARVTGVDASDQLIRIAKERSDPGIEYLVADARSMQVLPANHFHAACCVLAIQDIDAIAAVFEGVARTLVHNGRFVIAMMHPCFRGPKTTGWEWDRNTRSQFRRVDRYLLPRKEAIITHPGRDPRGSTWSFHRPLEAYVRALRQAGLFVDALEEWVSHKVSDSGPRAEAENIARREIPMFLALRAIKLDRSSSPPPPEAPPEPPASPAAPTA